MVTTEDRQAARRVRRRIHAAVDRDARGQDGWERQWKALRGELTAIPRSGRGRAWRETRLLLDLAFRQRPGKAFKQLQRMRQRRLEQGAGAAFDGFWAECEAVLTPYTLGPHGYELALRHRDHAALWREVEAVTRRLAAHGYETFVNSGTLLGLVRDGTFVAHDDDVDLAVLLPTDDSPDGAGAARAWLELRRVLAEAGVVDAEFDRREPRPKHCRAVTSGDVQVDLFPAWVGNGRIHVWPHTCGDLAADDVLPLASRTVAGTEVRLPRRPELMLESNYGPGWRSPDPTFRFDWRGARRRFGGFLEHLGFAPEDPS